VYFNISPKIELDQLGTSKQYQWFHSVLGELASDEWSQVHNFPMLAYDKTDPDSQILHHSLGEALQTVSKVMSSPRDAA